MTTTMQVTAEDQALMFINSLTEIGFTISEHNGIHADQRSATGLVRVWLEEFTVHVTEFTPSMVITGEARFNTSNLAAVRGYILALVFA